MIQEIRHKGGVVRQILAHPQDDGLAGKQTVPSRAPHQDIQKPEVTEHPATSHPSTPRMGPVTEPSQKAFSTLLVPPDFTPTAVFAVLV